MEAPIDRLLSLVRRELGAEDVRVLENDAEPPAASNVVHARMPDGRTVVVSYGSVPADRDARLRRLEMLIRTFAQSLLDDQEPGSRRPAATTLGEELRALTQRAQAINALVIDTESPIEWGSAVPGESARDSGKEAAGGTVAMLDWSRRQLMDGIRTDLDDEDANDASAGDLSGVAGTRLTDSAETPAAAAPATASAPTPTPKPPAAARLSEAPAPPPTDLERRQELSEDAKTAARALPGTAGLARGGHLHHAARGGPWFVARSFAGIYLLVVVFEGEYDELRAERAIIESLPRVERMVMALPPLDPEPAPTADVIRLRRRR